MERRRIAIPILIVTLVLLGLTAFHFGRKHSMDCSLALTYAVTTDARHGTWSIVSNDGFYTGAMFERDYEAQTGEALSETIDTDQNTYVVCYGFTLEELYYREGDMSGRFTGSRPYHYAKAVLRSASDGEVNIYLVHDPVSIDRDPHSNTGDDTAIVE